MKTAVCFIGRLTQKTVRDERSLVSQLHAKQNTVHPELSYKTFRKHLEEVNDPDIFIHSWATDYRQELLDLYKPRAHKIEDQVLLETPRGGDPNLVSCWYSMKSVGELLANYEREKGIKYDRVMLTRLDLLYFTDYRLEDFDPDKFHTLGHLASKVPGFLMDWHFISSSDNMQKFCRIFDHRDQYKPVAHTTIGHYIQDHVTPQIDDSKKFVVLDVMIPRYMNLIFELENHPRRKRLVPEIIALLEKSTVTKKLLSDRYGIEKSEWDDYGYDDQL